MCVVVIAVFAAMLVGGIAGLIQVEREHKRECAECCKGIDGFKFDCFGCGVCPEAV